MRPIRCVFFGDLYPNKECYDAGTASGLRNLLKIRKNVASGPVTDYFEDPNYIGWVRRGEGHKICAVIISNADSYVPLTATSLKSLRGGKLKRLGPCFLFTVLVPRRPNLTPYACLSER